MEALRLLAAVATVVISVAALANATFLGGIVMKADGDGGSNSGGDSGGWDFPTTIYHFNTGAVWQQRRKARRQ